MQSMLAIMGMGMPELMVVVVLILILFGSSKIPQLMRGFGSGINEFKKGLKEGEKAELPPADDKKPSEANKEADPKA